MVTMELATLQNYDVKEKKTIPYSVSTKNQFSDLAPMKLAILATPVLTEKTRCNIGIL